MTSHITQYALDAIDRVQEHPHIVEYIRSFDKDGGYIYKDADDERERKILKKELDNLLDNGKHTGPSTWEYMATLVHLVLSNILTREDLNKTKARQERDEAALSHVIEKIWFRNEQIKKERKLEIIKHAVELQKTAEAIMQRNNNSPTPEVIEELKNAVQIFHNDTSSDNNTATDKVIALLKKELIVVLKSMQAAKEIISISSHIEVKRYGEEVYEQMVNEALQSAEDQTPEFLRAVMQTSSYVRPKTVRNESIQPAAVQQQQEEESISIVIKEKEPVVIKEKEASETVEKKNKVPKEVKVPKVKAVKEPKVKLPKVKAVKEPKVKEPKVKEEVKSVEEPKVKEPKVKEPKVKEPKVKEPKVKEPKVKEPKVKEPKVKEPKVKEPKVKE